VSFAPKTKVRTETFTVAEACNVKVSVASGDVRVTTHSGDTVQVKLLAKDQGTVDNATISYDESSNSIVVHQNHHGGGSRFNISFGLRTDSPDVELVVPRETKVEVNSASGDIVVADRIAALKVKTASGDVRAAADRVEVASASGDVVTDEVVSISVASASGDVRTGMVTGNAKLNTVSGDVYVNYGGDGGATITTVSGDVHLGVERGRLVEFNVHSRTGDIKSSLDSSGERDGDEIPSHVKVSTLSGDVQLVSA
jgi:DUF4097 and DUF4098 domain-containing protein YvlB